MTPQFVMPSVKTHKNDAAVAEAICEGVARLKMRFVRFRPNRELHTAGGARTASSASKLHQGSIGASQIKLAGCLVNSAGSFRKSIANIAKRRISTPD